jgi:hypothetical protein
MARDPFPRDRSLLYPSLTRNSQKRSVSLLVQTKGLATGMGFVGQRKTSVEACISTGSVGDRSNRTDRTRRSRKANGQLESPKFESANDEDDQREAHYFVTLIDREKRVLHRNNIVVIN